MNARAFGDFDIPEALGDARWTDELILSTWYMAETGKVPEKLNFKTGNSDGGFDLLRFQFLDESGWVEHSENISTKLDLNRRGDEKNKISIDIPWYGGGMSYGSVSVNVMMSRARNARRWNSFISTGEGGYPAELREVEENVITQVATGYFGVEEDTIQAAPIVEFKYAQGAKPGLGGHLLAAKAGEEVAKLRGSVPFVSLFSPFPFHSTYSVEDHSKHLDWIETVNPKALLSVKVSTPHDVDMVAVGSFYAGAHIIHLDGGYGGTGAAPEIAKKNIAMPIELAIPKVHKFLVAEGVRDRVTLIASGGIRTADDMAKAIALGADGCVLGTSDLIGLGCTRCSNCEGGPSGRGCPWGLTTTDIELQEWVPQDWAVQRLDNLYSAMQWRMRDILRKLGLDDVNQLRGRTDLLQYIPKEASE
ncbi:MAG: FMN-binding glutamate synthase family protein [Euryarchaeota archaeon]|nr:FMN-binding glutamate synthase family protein [Euryarchaeota archaeon]HIL65676.1 FMN-binding glutamate synthase family protein [Candidatus Poseidoniales archaeon]MBT3654579.1 FMN-binding glutamate synthase family protein [Euryarchaeota archaeon]MBT3757411.1 FMN-binding glutamate synthase family protein [Euryarchaeota archaeon]MBT4050683.1 FMN-binding glutamate synthase family protein [Euryarchaeota archaeon]